MKRRSLWLPLAFVAGFLAVGLPYWQIPYAKLELPDALIGPGLLVVAAAALLTRAVGRKMRVRETSTRRTRFGTIRFYGPRLHEVAIIKCILQNLVVLGSTHQAHRVILGRAYPGHHLRPPGRSPGWKPEPPSSRPEGNQEARCALRRPVDLRALPVRHHASQAFHHRRTDRGRDGLDSVDSGPGRGSAPGRHRESAPDGNRDAGWGARGAGEPPSAIPDVVGLRVDFEETDLWQKMKALGAKWDPGRRLWLLRRDRAIGLGLQARIATPTGKQKVYAI